MQLGDLVKVERLKKPEGKGVQMELTTVPGSDVSLSEIASNIEADRGVSAQSLAEVVSGFKESVRQSATLNYYGDEISYEDFKAMENREDNARIYREMDEGNFRNVPYLTYLPLKYATSIVERFSGQVMLAQVHQISDQVARELAKYRWGIHFDGLETLTDEAAAALTKTKGPISLVFLLRISEDAARSLAQREQRLTFNSSEVTQKVAKYRKDEI